MFIFDQLKREDRQIKVVAFAILLGMGVLLAGLWYVQVVSSAKFTSNMQKQTFRSVRVPAIRGKILDRNGFAIADNKPSYGVNLYLEEILAPLDATNVAAIRAAYRRQHPGAKMDAAALREISRINQLTRYQVVSNETVRASMILQRPVAPTPERFFYHAKEWTYMPFPILPNLTQKQVTLYYEQLASESSIDLDIQPIRFYPYGSTLAHLLGYARTQDWSDEDEDINFQYYLPFWKGKAGLEYAFDGDLRGKAGVKWVLVNNYSYRQREETKTPAEAGADLYLTIDLNLQRAAERALPPSAQAAIVVMDVHNGDILALASSPTYDPNIWTKPIPTAEWTRLNDERLRPMFNRATGAYSPGSVFKIITSIACLESGLNPKELYSNLGYYPLSATRSIKDTAPPGDYDFERAFYKSSNSYFINYGRKAGARKLIEVGKRFHFGEPTELGIGTESAGDFPRPEQSGKWIESDLAFASIGQIITVTPVQIAGMISAIANGGTLYWPRVVSHLRTPDSGEVETVNPQGRLRDTIQLNPKHLDIIRHAMLMDTQHPGASAYDAFFGRDGQPIAPSLENFHVAGKTGTAERDVFGARDKVTWFASYGPYENPRYAVVVMIEEGASGGKSCGPVAREIYEAIVKMEQRSAPAKPTGLAQN